jgi:hypothetical protein
MIPRVYGKYRLRNRRGRGTYGTPAVCQVMAVTMNPITMTRPKITKITYVQLTGRRRGGGDFFVFEYISSPRTPL